MASKPVSEYAIATHPVTFSTAAENRRSLHHPFAIPSPMAVGNTPNGQLTLLSVNNFSRSRELDQTAIALAGHDADLLTLAPGG